MTVSLLSSLPVAQVGAWPGAGRIWTCTQYGLCLLPSEVHTSDTWPCVTYLCSQSLQGSQVSVTWSGSVLALRPKQRFHYDGWCCASGWRHCSSKLCTRRGWCADWAQLPRLCCAAIPADLACTRHRPTAERLTHAHAQWFSLKWAEGLDWALVSVWHLHQIWKADGLSAVSAEGQWADSRCQIPDKPQVYILCRTVFIREFCVLQVLTRGQDAWCTEHAFEECPRESR